jgi:catechol 2,3-dioxygenase-like lactoylglutathione lyase family enzyme
MNDTPPASRSVVYAKDMPRVAAFYQRTLGLSELERDAGFMRLGGPTFEVVVVRMPEAIARTVDIATPPLLREDTPLKCSFRVADLERVAADAAATGGGTRPVSEAWTWLGERHLDGHDPEGNVVQFRQRAD